MARECDTADTIRLRVCAKALHTAGLLTDADYHRMVNRIKGRENVRENVA